MRRNIIPAGDGHAVAINADPDEPISIEDTSESPYPYSQTLAMLSLGAAEAVGRALLEAVTRLSPPTSSPIHGSAGEAVATLDPMDPAPPRIVQTWTSMEEPIQVIAELDDGSRVELFAFYSDELCFNEEELVGLTVDQARYLHHRRDVGYLQS